MQVPPAYITRVVSIPDIDNSQVNITVQASTAATGMTASLKITFNGQTVATKQGSVNTLLTVKIPSRKLWTPATPNLYQVFVTLASTGEAGQS